MYTNRTALFSRHQPGGVFTVDDLAEHPGAIFFVGSTVTGATNGVGYGRNPDAPFATLSYALSSDVCSASVGDTIYLLPGHTEACIAAGTITADIAGVRIIGLGEGSIRPKITFTTSANASFLVSAADVSIKNVVFDSTGVDSVNKPLNITGAGCTVRHCEFEHADASGQSDYAIVTAATANDLVVEENYFFGTGDGGTTAAIQIVGGDSAVIRRNRMFGAYTNTSGGIVNDTTAATNLLIEDNIIDNRTAGSTKAMIADGSTTGVIRGNVFCVLSGIAPVTAAAMMWGGGNTFTNAVATEAAGLETTDSTLNFIGVDDNNNAVATTNVAANEDGSILERLEQIQEAINNGTGTSIASNKSIVDLLGTTGSALVDDAVSVVGILGVDDSNNAFASTSVVANADGSILERLEYIQANATPQTPATYVPGLGFKVTKTEDVNTATSDDLFDVTGKVLIKLWTIEVTNIIGAQPNDYILRIKTDNVALTASSDISAAAIGVIMNVTGDAGDTLETAGEGIKTCDFSDSGMTNRVVGLAGGTCTLQSVRTAGDSGDAMIHTIFYLPLEASAAVAAAA